MKDHEHHHHGGHHHHHHVHGAISSLKAVFFANLLFSFVELFGGVYTNSVSTLSSALHDFGDSLALGLAWYLETLSHKSADTRYSYGYRRFSLLSAIITIFILLVGSTFILFESVKRLTNPEPILPGGVMAVAVLGILVNGYGAWRVSRHHSHNHRAAFLHQLEDLLGWGAVLASAVLIYFTQKPILDPILSILINIFILYNVIRRLKDIVRIFLQGVPGSLDLEVIKTHAMEIPYVKDVHYIQAWSLDGEQHVLNCHIVVADEATRDQIIELKRSVKTEMREHHFEEVTIEIEFECETCEPHKPH